MGQFLTFSLIAPMASFGDIAAGGYRDSSLRPARSAVLGLVAGCLGITREEEAKHQTLSEHYGVAMLCDVPGNVLIDYQTAQMAPATRKRVYATRAEELSVNQEDIDTVLSRRQYRMGSWHLGALWLRDSAGPWSLEVLKEAMERPVFAPYWGRKSCPFGLPFSPEIVDAVSVTEALCERQENGKEAALLYNFKKIEKRRKKLAEEKKEAEKAVKTSQSLQEEGDSSNEGPSQELEKKAQKVAEKPHDFFRYWHSPERMQDGQNKKPVTIVMDADDVKAYGGNWTVLHRLSRRDRVLSRTCWEFGLREEAVLTMPLKEKSL